MNENENQTVQPRKPKTLDKQVYEILGMSDILGRFIPTSHGQFESIRDAEVFGLEKFKFTRWRVAKPVKRKNEAGKDETQYDFVSDIFDPKYKNED